MSRVPIILRTCICIGGLAAGNAWGAQKVYWADAGAGRVRRADLNGSNVEDLVTGGSPNGVAVDYCGGKLYWTDGTSAKIRRANLDGSGAEDLVTSGLMTPHGIALDLVNAKMYWGDGTANTITRANLDGSNVETVVTEARPIGVGLDVDVGKVYWADIGATPSYRRADMNGLNSNVETLVPNIPNASGIALDLIAGKMYFTQHVVAPISTGSIRRADLNGSNLETLVTTPGRLFAGVGIALDGAGRMYWGETGPPATVIRSANVNGSGMQTVTTAVTTPRGITVAPNFANFGNFSDRDSDADGLCNSSDPCPFDAYNTIVDGNCIPTLSEWGMMAMGGLMVAAGRLVIKRRRAGTLSPRRGAGV